jgi:hypothetical protein
LTIILDLADEQLSPLSGQRKMLCGNFSKRKSKMLTLADVDEKVLINALDLWCGRNQEVELGEVPQLSSVALHSAFCSYGNTSEAFKGYIAYLQPSNY